MSTHNIGFDEDLTKVIFELSSNTHLISSAEYTELRLSDILLDRTFYPNVAIILIPAKNLQKGFSLTNPNFVTFIFLN